MSTESGGVGECLYVAGHAGLAEFLGFIANQASPEEFDDPREWTEDWNLASRQFRALERSESGYADGATVLPLPAEVAELEKQVLAAPSFRQAFPVLPTRLGVVQLDRLIVCQKYVSVNHVQRIQAALPATFTLEDVFKVCLPLAQACPPVRQLRQGPNSWVFVSPAPGIRLLESLVTQPPPEYQSRGPTFGVCGAVVGFPTQYVNVIQAGTRLILNNGTHRALALLEKGVTRIPCAIQQAATADELMVVGSPEVLQNAALYLQSARPPLLRDFLDPKLSRRLAVPRTKKYLKVTIQTEEIELPDDVPA